MISDLFFKIYRFILLILLILSNDHTGMNYICNGIIEHQSHIHV